MAKNTVKLNTKLENLVVLLTAEEVADRAAKLAQVVGEMERLREEKQEFNASFKERMEPLINQHSELARAVRYRQELRDVPVDEVADFATGQVSVVRQDTGEVVRETRPLTPEERQGRLMEIPKRKAGGESGKAQE